MIDFLCIRVPFSRHCYSAEVEDHARLDSSVLDYLKIKKSMHYDEDGNLTNVSIPWHSVPSDFSSMAFKINLPDRVGYPYIEFKASPAKLKQGHNVFGSDDMREALHTMFHVLTMGHPELFLDFECNRVSKSMIRWDWAEIMYLDVTYHSWATTNQEALDFIQAVKHISNKQVKSAVDGNKGLQTFNSTAYWNPESERRRLKLYHKLKEVEFQRSKLKTDIEKAKHDRIFDQKMLDYMKGMLRFETRVYKRQLLDHGFDVRPIVYLESEQSKIVRQQRQKKRNQSAVQVEDKKYINARKLWDLSFRDLFKAFEGQNMKLATSSDEHILKKLRKSIHVKRTYTRKIMVVDEDFSEFDKLIEKSYQVTFAERVKDDVFLVWLDKHTINTGQADAAFNTYLDVKRYGFANWLQQRASKAYMASQP